MPFIAKGNLIDVIDEVWSNGIDILLYDALCLFESMLDKAAGLLLQNIRARKEESTLSDVVNDADNPDILDMFLGDLFKGNAGITMTFAIGS